MSAVPHSVYFVSGVDFVGEQLTEVGAGKLRQKIKAGLKKGVKVAARLSVGIPPRLSHRTMLAGEYSSSSVGFALEPGWNELVEGIDYVRGREGDVLTEVGAGKVAKKIKAGLKKAGKAVGKVAQGVLKVASKIVPPPYNVAFQAGSKIADKAASAVQKAKAGKAVKGLAALAKRGDKKAAATLVALKVTKDAAEGKPAAGLKLVAAAQAKAAKPAPAGGTYEVLNVQSGRRFSVRA